MKADSPLSSSLPASVLLASFPVGMPTTYVSGLRLLGEPRPLSFQAGRTWALQLLGSMETSPRAAGAPQ